MNIELVAKHPFTTWSVEICHSPDDAKQYQALTTALQGIGWKIDPIKTPPLKGVQTDVFFVDGTGIFEGWTPEEETQNMDALKRMFKRLNIQMPKKHKLTAMEQL
jgi:hypothetical protein